MTRKFRKMYNDILSRKDLNAGAKLIYSVLADRQGNNGYCWPGMRTLAKDVGMSKGAAQRAITSLEKAGLIVIRRSVKGGGSEYSMIESVPETGTDTTRPSVPEMEPDRTRFEPTVPETSTKPYPKRVLNQTKESDSVNQTKEPDAFDVFWKAYPGKKGGGKEKLRKKWKLDKLDSKAEHVMAVVAAKKQTEQWTKDNGQYIPMLSTFLNQQRWDCDIADITAAPKRKTVDQILAGE